jgi:flagellum-specific ATP synthase
MVEQCGALKSGGSISAVMTVLSENDDVDDPLCELMKSLLDGHLVLSRTLAERGQFPAIDPLKSVSRNAPALMERRHRELARRAHALISRYESARSLIESGLYTAGGNSEIDAAVAAKASLEAFLGQAMDESTDMAEMVSGLEAALGVDHARA